MLGVQVIIHKHSVQKIEKTVRFFFISIMTTIVITIFIGLRIIRLDTDFPSVGLYHLNLHIN